MKSFKELLIDYIRENNIVNSEYKKIIINRLDYDKNGLEYFINWSAHNYQIVYSGIISIRKKDLDFYIKSNKRDYYIECILSNS